MDHEGCGYLGRCTWNPSVLSSPIYSIRFNNMMEDWYDTTNKTIDLFGVRNENLSDNVKETIEWLKGEGVSFFPYWKKKYGKN